MQAFQMRPDLRAAQQGITAANSQYLLAKADSKEDLTVQANYTHVNGINGVSFYTSIPLPIFNRNQGEIARTRYAITQSQELGKQAGNQVATDVNDAYYILQTTIVAAQGPDSTLSAALGKDMKGKISPVLYAVAIPSAFLSRWIAVGLYVVVALMWLVPDRRLEPGRPGPPGRPASTST